MGGYDDNPVSNPMTGKATQEVFVNLEDWRRISLEWPVQVCAA